MARPSIILLFTLFILSGCDARMLATVEPPAGHTPTIPTPTPYVEPLVPTSIATSNGLRVGLTALNTPTLATPTPIADSPLVIAAATPEPLPTPDSLRWRAGVGIPDGESPLLYQWTSPRPGWYLNWTVGLTQTGWLSPTVTLSDTPGLATEETLPFHVPPDTVAGMEFVPMVRTFAGRLHPPADWLRAVALAKPGRTWLVGNEPDVRWQDNATPEEYARAYHAAYTTIKTADPTAQVAIGGLSQITPLRIAYLDRVWVFYLATYGEEMPVDVWTMHAFVLQEKAGEWGVDIPPGFANIGEGERWQIEDHADLALVEEQIRRMRAWMADHGQQEKPLWVTEYGILMPASYGFDESTVRRFLIGSYDLFNTLRDAEMGYAADDHRLVQRWVWFSTGYDLYPTGDLFTRQGIPTGLMEALSAYLAEFGEQ